MFVPLQAKNLKNQMNFRSVLKDCQLIIIGAESCVTCSGRLPGHAPDLTRPPAGSPGGGEAGRGQAAAGGQLGPAGEL